MSMSLPPRLSMTLMLPWTAGHHCRHRCSRWSGGVVAATAGSVEAPATAIATATAGDGDTAGAVEFAVGAGAVDFGVVAFLTMALAEPMGENCQRSLHT